MKIVEPKKGYSTFWNVLKTSFSNVKCFVCVCSYLRSLQNNSMDDLELYSTPQIKASW